jgi:chemotaxis protein MotB
MRRIGLMWAVLVSGCVSNAKYAELQVKYDDLENRSSSSSSEMSTQLERAAEQVDELEGKLDKVKAHFQRRVERADALRTELKPLVDRGVLELRLVEGQVTLGLGSDVLFASGSATVSDDGKEFLSRVAGALSKKTEASIQVQGHSDSQPISSRSFPSNWHLAAARAIAVVDVMVQAGLPAEQVYAASYGDTRPIATNDTADGRALNRRIDIALVPDLSTMPGFNLLARKDNGVLSVLRRHRKKTRACVDKARKRQTDVDGEVRVSFQVVDAKATQVTVVGNTTGSDPFGVCVAGAIEQMGFDGVRDGAYEQSFSF